LSVVNAVRACSSSAVAELTEVTFDVARPRTTRGTQLGKELPRGRLDLVVQDDRCGARRLEPIQRGENLPAAGLGLRVGRRLSAGHSAQVGAR
jgi:hypothetical protein